MKNFNLLVAKEIREDSLEISFSKEHERKTAPEIDLNIQKEWERALEETPKLFPGLKFRLSKVQEVNGKVIISLGMTNYKDYVGTNLANNLNVLKERGLKEGDENLYLSNPLGNMCVTETSDGKIVFIKRSNKVAEYKGFIDVPGGHPEPDLAGITLENMFDYSKSQEELKKVLFDSVEEELISELNVTQADMGKITCIGIITNTETNKPDIIFHAKLTISSKQLEELYREGPEESFESDDIIFVDKEGLDEYRKNNKITPATYASIECFLRLNY